MTNEEAIKALKEIEAYCTATQLDKLNYVLTVMEKLAKDGVKDPLSADFTKVAN